MGARSLEAPILAATGGTKCRLGSCEAQSVFIKLKGMGGETRSALRTCTRAWRLEVGARSLEALRLAATGGTKRRLAWKLKGIDGEMHSAL